MFTRNSLDKPFFSNHNSGNHKRKPEYRRVSTDESALSCSPKTKKLKAAESKYDYTSYSVPSATRYLLDSLNKPFFSGVMIEPEENSRVSTELKLFDETWVTSNNPVVLDPWKIKKKLTESDAGPTLTRLLVHKGVVEEHILPLIEATEEQIDKGINVRVWDFDTSTLHNMNFQRWISSDSYVLKKRWVKDFVKRRELKENDTIGLYWNVAESRFHFCVLGRAAAQLV